jgi:hypothetical protein
VPRRVIISVVAGGAVLQASGTRRGPGRGSRWAFVSVALPFAILAGIAVFAAVSPYESTKTPPPGTHGSLVWGDGIFSNRVEMKAWLKLHGAHYAPWAKLHPKALSLVKPLPKPHRAALAVKKRHGAAVAVKKKTPKAHHVAAPARVTATTSHRVALAAPAAASQRNQSSVRWLFIVLGLLISMVAVLTPKRISVRVGLIADDREREVRLAVAGVGFAVLCGAAAGLFLG